MELKAAKQELIEWLTKMEDEETIEVLTDFKNASTDDWFADLNDEHKAGIERGLKDISEGNVIAHSEVSKKYGL